MNKYNVLHKSRSGFRKNHSCNTVLIYLVDRWLSNIYKGENNGAIFFYLRKAFDIVDHTTLISKLTAYTFDQTLLNWVQSYLTNRKQCILNGNTISSMLKNKSGVPHGSFIGPARSLPFICKWPTFICKRGIFSFIRRWCNNAYVQQNNNNDKYQLQIGAQDFNYWCAMH